MTSPRTAARARRLSREQAVAALLVGAVVILLGFASGLGLDPAASTSSAAQPTPASSTPAAPAATTPPAVPVAVTTPPVVYVAEPAPPAVPVAIAPPPVSESTALPTTPPASPSSSGTPSSHPTTPTTPAPPSTTPAPPSCSPGLLSSLLGALLPSTGDGAGGLLGLGSLLGTIDQITGALHLLSGGSGGLLDQVTGLLALPSVLPGGHPSKALAQSCSGEARKALSLVAAGADVPTAVQAAGR